MSTSASSLMNYLPAVDAPKSTPGMIYAIGVPVVIGYLLYDQGMPEGAAEWVASVILALVALGFTLNMVKVQFNSAVAAGATA